MPKRSQLLCKASPIKSSSNYAIHTLHLNFSPFNPSPFLFISSLRGSILFLPLLFVQTSDISSFGSKKIWQCRYKSMPVWLYESTQNISQWPLYIKDIWMWINSWFTQKQFGCESMAAFAQKSCINGHLERCTQLERSFKNICFNEPRVKRKASQFNSF